ncbi:type II toxin-antitoxin system Phd/YefM family antitoxin [Candidatus Peregrinibacteria bacterium]|nr:type II toxin-antitoxin system Phd/YefM family antitoxin [Candidatus Peregrinibacteria bacterium]
MVTKLIGMKDFRQNMASYVKASRKGGIRYIILKKNVPVLEVKPIDEKEFAMEKLYQEILAAEEEVKRGEVYSLEEVMKEFGML